MTRAQMRTELTTRGWSRYSTAELDRYLDWGLRAVARAFRWESVEAAAAISSYGAGANEHLISLNDAAFNVAAGPRTVTHVYVVTPNEDERKLEPMDDATFHGVWAFETSTESENQGTPVYYFIHRDSIWLMPFPDQDYDFTVTYLPEFSSFSGDGVTSGLPEVLDAAIVLEAEGYCFQRAKEFENMAVAQGEARRIVMEEAARDASRMDEDHGRVIPYR